MEDNVDIGDIHDLLVPEVSMSVDDAPMELNENEAEQSIEIPHEEQNGDLVPEVSMNVDDAPIELNENEAEQSIEIPHEEQNGDVTIIDDVDEPKSTSKKVAPPAANQENLNPNQVPDDYTLEEMTVCQQLFAPGQQAVQFLRTHCTACNTHLGSSPNKQNKRYIHPLLKVLICKLCFDFYGSGDFDKDDDGSEVYCRWCGQGGKVLCCAQCPYVFCQRCIKVNLGKKALDMVKESDDWLCYVCKPEQIIKLRVTCRALYEFVREEFRLAAELKQPERLTVDSSMCCINRPKTAAPKRKRSTSTDRPYDVNFDDKGFRRKKKPKHNILTHILSGANENMSPLSNTYMPAMLPRAWQSQDEDEVVCTPDLSMLMDDEEAAETQDASPGPSESPQPSSSTVSFLPDAMPFLPDPTPYQDVDANNAREPDIQYVNQSRIATYPPAKVAAPVVKKVNAKSAFGYKLPKRPMILNTSTTKPLTTTSKNVTPNLVRLQAPAVRFSNTNTPVVRVSHSHNNSVIDTSVPARLAPGLRYEWFEKATQFTAKVNQNLSTRLCSLSKEQSTVTSLEGLAGIHNNLQEILSNSINSLMQIRKTLRSDFIAGLKKLKFCQTPDNVPQAPPPEDNDVIIVDSHTPNNTNITNNTNNNKSRGYVKVKPNSELYSSVITIPDDVPPESNGTSLENDPLSVVENVTEPANVTKEPENVTSKPENATNGPENAANEPEPVQNGNKEPQASSYIDTNEALSEIPEGLNPETLSLIKSALVESKFETILNNNSKIPVKDVPPEHFKRMLAVRVIVETNYGEATPRTKRRKGYKAMNIAAVDEQDIEQMLSSSIVVNNTKRKKAFDDSFSAFVANITQKSQEESPDCDDKGEDDGAAKDADSVEVHGLSTDIENEESSSQDPQTVDSGIDADGEQSLSNEIVSCQDN